MEAFLQALDHYTVPGIYPEELDYIDDPNVKDDSLEVTHNLFYLKNPAIRETFYFGHNLFRLDMFEFLQGCYMPFVADGKLYCELPPDRLDDEKKNNLKSTDTKSINRWVDQHSMLSMWVTKKGEVVYNSDTDQYDEDYSGSADTSRRNRPLYITFADGKTEVFLSVAKKVLEQGKGVLYLVPEIGLTPQVVQAVSRRFGDTVAVLHSALTGAQKLGEWKRILRKEARVVIGARSAVFAPLPDLGLIIIDEEHDSSYKSGNSPRYHARQVAMRRASRLGIPLVMGSATPSVESWKAIDDGLFSVHRLTKRLSGGKMPLISLVDLSREKMTGSISTILENEIRQTLKEKRQSILFLNRRGFNHIFRCSVCGFELKCKNCSVPMTYHKAQNRLVCHYCSYSVEPFGVCPQCGSVDIGYFGFGTEFIESEVKSKFPNARTLRLDTDAVSKKDELEEKIAAFKSGQFDILLGTQMIAKGLNFPSLKLVGVILADTSLHLPDFRAAEKTFSLITQVAGRAGRFFPDGKVFVQTYSPGNSAIYCACHSRVEEFYKQELQTRKLLNFPPYARLLRLVFRSMSQIDAESFANDAERILSEELKTLQESHAAGTDSVEILGPSECPLSKISSNWRYQILLRAPHVLLLQKLAGKLIYGYRAKEGVYIEVDVDPVSLL